MISLDTNIFVYLFDQSEPEKQAIAIEVVRAVSQLQSILSLQVIGEFYAAARRALKIPAWEAAQHARNIGTGFDTCSFDHSDMLSALSDAATGRFSYWDGLLLSACISNGCNVLFSEDLQDGYVRSGLEIVNPFAEGGLSARAREILSPPKPA